VRKIDKCWYEFKKEVVHKLVRARRWMTKASEIAREKIFRRKLEQKVLLWRGESGLHTKSEDFSDELLC